VGTIEQQGVATALCGLAKFGHDSVLAARNPLHGRSIAL